MWTDWEEGRNKSEGRLINAGKIFAGRREFARSIKQSPMNESEPFEQSLDTQAASVSSAPETYPY